MARKKPAREAGPQEGIELIQGKTYAVRWEEGKVAEVYGEIVASYRMKDKKLAEFHAKRDLEFEMFILQNGHNYVIDTKRKGVPGQAVQEPPGT